MLKSILVGTTGLLLLITPSSAKSVPELSGSYALNYSVICQAVESSSPGITIVESVIAKFDRSDGMVQLTGTETSGDLVVWSGGTAGVTQSGVSQSQTYSNTATTVTFDALTYSAVYGPVSDGIAQSMLVSGIPNAGCTLSGTFIRQ